jgi:hypothetical protein
MRLPEDALQSVVTFTRNGETLMISRIGLFVASLAAAGTLAFALVAMHAWPPQPAAATIVSAEQPAASTAAPTAELPTTQVDTIYLAPRPAQQTITVHKVVRGAGGGDGEGTEHEGGEGAGND